MDEFKFNSLSNLFHSTVLLSKEKRYECLQEIHENKIIWRNYVPLENDTNLEKT